MSSFIGEAEPVPTHGVSSSDEDYPLCIRIPSELSFALEDPTPLCNNNNLDPCIELDEDTSIYGKLNKQNKKQKTKNKTNKANKANTHERL